MLSTMVASSSVLEMTAMPPPRLFFGLGLESALSLLVLYLIRFSGVLDFLCLVAKFL